MTRVTIVGAGPGSADLITLRGARALAGAAVVLHDEFMPSIGCAPCTRAIAVGEDFRAGRWWWEDEAAKECGLHATKAAPAIAA